MSVTGTAVITPLQQETINTYVEVYSRFTRTQKRCMTALLAYCGLSATMSTTSVLSAVPEIVSDFGTTANVVTISNALYLLVMGISSCLWGPASDVFGRRKIYLCTLVLFCAFSLGTALSPSIAVFFVFRAITAAQGIAFLILGSSCISDIYHPSERGISLAWFLAGSMSGYAFGPIIGGAIVTYTSWRVVFWLQTGMSGSALISIYFFLKETLLRLNRSSRTAELDVKAPIKAAEKLWQWINPLGTIKLYRQRNLLFPILASSALVWNMYSLLTPVRYVLNPRLNLATPLQSGLLFLAPGAGYLVGVQIGGRWADFVMKYWTEKRGYRRPEDRLRSSLFFLGLLLPGAMIVYGWMVDQRIGGIPVPVIAMFVQGVAQTASFVSLNAYILDVMQHRSGQVSASHYMMRFTIAAVGTAVCLPLIDRIGVGWTSTISSAFLVATTVLTCWTLISGESWRESSSV